MKEDLTQVMVANIKGIFKEIPFFDDVIRKLNSKGIRYGIYGSAIVQIITSQRIYSDIDVVVYDDDDILKIKEIFPLAATADGGTSQFLYIGLGRELEFVCGFPPEIEGHLYRFDLTELALKNIWRIEVNNTSINLMNPFDTILMKAILQNFRRDSEVRGKIVMDPTKDDLGDITKLLEFVELDKGYVSERIKEVNPDARLLNCLRRFNIVG